MRVPIRPSRAASVGGVIGGLAFIGFGIWMASYTSGPGVFIILIGVVALGLNAFNLATGKGLAAEVADFEDAPHGTTSSAVKTSDVESRLSELEQLRSNGTITSAEHARERKRVLGKL